MQRYQVEGWAYKINEDDHGEFIKHYDYKKEMQGLIDTCDKLIAQKDEEIERLKKHNEDYHRFCA